MRTTLIAGLPGCGKSTLAREIASLEPGCVVLDDPDSASELDGIPPGTPSMVISHPVFCRYFARMRIEQEVYRRFPDAEIIWIFFENDPDTCRRNAAERNDGREVSGYITLLTKVYDIPPGADVRRVYRDPDHGVSALDAGPPGPR